MRAKLVEIQNFEKNIHPKEALGIGGVSLGKARYEAKLKAIEDWNNWLENLLVGKKISAKVKHIYTHTEDGMEFDGKDEWVNETLNVESIHRSDTPWDDHSLQINTTDKKVYALPINDTKVFIEGPIKENQNFERGVDNPSDLGLGKWKIWEDDSFADQEKGTKVSLEEFSQNGGILKPGREIWKMDDSNKWPVGEYLGYDENQHINLAKNDRFKSFPVGWKDHGVRVKTKVLYQ